ncbi:MAG: isopentenyl phosphate kinase, partial [Promethearchaeota archaeon]
MLRKNEIILLKLGGSLLTEKNIPYSLRKDIIIRVIRQIKRAGLSGNLILIHGGGSFGHPVAKEYNIVKGIDKSIKNQIHGLSKTHQKMNELNSYIIEKLMEENMAVLSIQPSSIFLLDKGTIVVQGIKTIESCLKLGIIPILYGDIILDSEGSFSILSGDQILLLLCEHLKDHQVAKVIFATDVDGIYVEEEQGSNPKLALTLSSDQFEHAPLANLGQKIDVTGSMRGKLNNIKKICELGISVQIINGLKNDYLYKALKSEPFPCTTIHLEFNSSESLAISNRKLEHLLIPLNHDVQHARNYFEDVILLHHAFPEIDFNEVDLITSFFNKKVSAPICIAALTGGHPLSLKINKILAQAAEEENIILSVGSQRAGLIDTELEKSFSIVRDHAPTIPIIGNIGIGQVAHPDFSPSDFNA